MREAKARGERVEDVPRGDWQFDRIADVRIYYLQERFAALAQQFHRGDPQEMARWKLFEETTVDMIRTTFHAYVLCLRRQREGILALHARSLGMSEEMVSTLRQLPGEALTELAEEIPSHTAPARPRPHLVKR